MKKLLLAIQFIILSNPFCVACKCDSLITTGMLWSHSPVIFVGTYDGYNSSGLCNFNIIERIKGLPSNVGNLVMENASCNGHYSQGKYYLVYTQSFYRGYEPFYFSFSNCYGTKEIGKNYKTEEEYKILSDYSKTYGDSIIDLKNTVNAKLKLFSSLQTVFINELDTAIINKKNREELKAQKIQTKLDSIGINNTIHYSIIGLLLLVCIFLIIKIKRS